MTAIAKGNVKDDTARLKVLDAIKAAAGPITVSDVVAATGLAPHLAEGQLSDLVREYDSELDVDDEGNLIYKFAPSLAAREDIVKADAARRRKEAFKQGAISFFKGWTVAMVIVYFIVLMALTVAMLVAMMSQNEDSDSGRGSSNRRSGGGGWFFLWSTGSPWGYGGYGRRRSRRRRRTFNRELERKLKKGHDPYDMRAPADTETKPSLRERTWFFLFGTEGIKKNPLEREKELLTYIRAKKGFVSNADIIALLGVTYDEADAIGTRLVATYEGELDITDDGIAIYRFPNLMLSGAPEVAEQAPDLGYLWQVRQKEHLLRKSPTILVPVLCAINIVLALVMQFKGLAILGMTGMAYKVMLVWVPLIFSVMFFAIAFRRMSRDAANKGKYERDNIRMSIFRLLFSRRQAVRIPADAAAIGQSGLGPWAPDQLRGVAEKIAEELRGTAHTTNGQLTISADRVWQEMATVDKLRATANSTRSVGRTVFSSHDFAGSESANSEVEGEDLTSAIEELEAELGM